MKNIFYTAGIVLILGSCGNEIEQGKKEQLPGIHAALVQEVLQATQYTYLRVKEGPDEFWLAARKMNFEPGDSCYYKEGMLMTGFRSKDLDKTFDEIFFIDFISDDPASPDLSAAADTGSAVGMPVTDQGAAGTAQDDSHSILAEEVLQTTQYTYIKGKEGDRSYWMAVSKMQAEPGKTYFFRGGMLMKEFPSKELNRTFKEILFVDNISAEPLLAATAAPVSAQGNTTSTTGSSVPAEKKAVNVKHAKDELTLAELFGKKKDLSGKVIRIRGEVTKFNPNIMQKNWIHLQDGTEYSGKFDLVITTGQQVKVGDQVVLEGRISLDKDFGYGYFYDVMMEDAKIVQ